MSAPSKPEGERRVREVAEAIAGVLEPLPPDTRIRALGAAICLTDTELAQVVIRAFMVKPL